MTKNYIVIHHSLTKDSDTVSWGAIRKYHVNTLGFRACGYHWGVERVNGFYEVLMGRFMDDTGAHCRDAMMNQKGIGICCVGNWDLEEPPGDLLETTRKLCKWIMKLYDIPSQNVLGHWEAQALGGVAENARKTCPGTKFDMEAFRGSLLA